MEDKEKIKSEFKKLYQGIDECVTSLIRARKLHDGAAVAKAYQRMETLMVATQQDITWLLDNLQEEPVSEDLEKVAKECANSQYPPEHEMPDDNYKQRNAFVKGFYRCAKWKEKQIMKQAVGGWVSDTLNHDIRITSEWLNEKKHPFKFGDKVKVVIIKEE